MTAERPDNGADDDGLAAEHFGLDPWLEGQARTLRGALAVEGWALPLETAVWIVRDRLAHAAASSGLAPDVLRSLMTPDHVRAMAPVIAAELRRTRTPRRTPATDTARLDGPLGATFRASGRRA